MGDRIDLESARSMRERFLGEPAERGHAVQFYEDDSFLADTVAEFLAAGLRSGDRLVVIATAEHRSDFASRLDPAEVQAAVAAGKLTWLDAGETLTSFMVDDLPDAERFRATLSRALGEPPAATQSSGPALRAYGEMVDLLWKQGNPTGALRLEELWNQAALAYRFSLLCAYGLGNFGCEADSGRFVDVCRSHGYVLPSEGFSGLADDDARLREISLLQQRALALETEVQQRKELERTLLDALQERARVEQELRSSIEREREARQKAESSDAFKQMFLGMLGHDLRNPLSTILTTSRMMKIRRELSGDSQKRLDRVIASGERMQCMIEQILDVTRARLSAGIPIRVGDELDLLPRVLKIVEEVRSAHPTRAIVFQPEWPCRARVDGDRFEQVVSNLIGNAVAHGDPRRVITVRVERLDDGTRLSVHNFGPAIDPAFIPLLFDPFERGASRLGHSDGLGLGLYISKCIIEAHGGTIDVESAPTTGTRFEVVLPRT